MQSIRQFGGTLFLVGFLPCLGAAAPITLVSTGAVWKYLDTGANAGSAWHAAGFDDSAWPAGPAQLGYGDNDEATTNRFGPDPNNKYITTYYRHTFELSDLASVTSLQLRLLRDDGAIIYLNDAEVFRSNLPPGPVSYLTQAQADAMRDGNNWIPVELSPAVLRIGTNVVAAEVHQVTPDSSDLSFDLELVANIPAAAPLLTTTYWPAASGGSGHFYEGVVMPFGVNWNNSSVNASNRGGYLATITSPLENAVIYDSIKNRPELWHDRGGDAYGPWIGGLQPPGSPEPGGGWTWITGEPFFYSHWASGEPSNRFGNEDRIHFFGRAAPIGDFWNDNAAADAETFGYIVEYDANLEPGPIFEFKFNETGTIALNSGKDTNAATFLQGSVAQDFHSANGEGVSGLPGDRAFDNRNTTGMGDIGTGGRAALSVDANSVDALLSFTVQGWFRTESASIDGLARLFAKYATSVGFHVFAENGNLTLEVNEVSRTSANQAYAEVREWIFFAVAYDGTRTTDNLRFFKGTHTAPVNQVDVQTLNEGPVLDNAIRPVIGNASAEGNLSRPFDGWLDNIRVFGSKVDATGALTLRQLEWFRTKDLQNHSTPVRLALRRSGTRIEVSWSAYPGNLKLQSTPDLHLWTDIPQTPGVGGDRKAVILQQQPGPVFFRLQSL